MSDVSDQSVQWVKLELLGFRWSQLQIGLWVYTHLPQLDGSTTEETREAEILKKLPYETFCKRLNIELSGDASSASAATLFFCNIGTQISQGFPKTSVSIEPIRAFLCDYLNCNRRKIEEDVRSPMSSSGGQNNQSKQINERPCIKVEHQQPIDAPRILQQGPDNHAYTSALKEMGDAECCLPTYKLVRLSLEPPRWRAEARYRSTNSFADASSKRAAKHLASRNLWIKIKGTPII